MRAMISKYGSKATLLLLGRGIGHKFVLLANDIPIAGLDLHEQVSAVPDQKFKLIRLAIDYGSPGLPLRGEFGLPHILATPRRTSTNCS